MMPDLTAQQSLEVSAIHSAAALLGPGRSMIVRPPVVHPMHPLTPASLLGGKRTLEPGAASLAHQGVLVLEDAHEHPGQVLEALCEPLDRNSITISRTSHTAALPASFLLAMVHNTDDDGDGTPSAPHPRQRHRIPGPVRDRIDIHQRVEPPSLTDIRRRTQTPETTTAVAERVAAARARQARRLAGTPWTLNGQVPADRLRREHPLEPDVIGPADNKLRIGEVSARGRDCIVRMAWTIADLAGRDRPTRDDVAYAIDLRMGETPWR